MAVAQTISFGPPKALVNGGAAAIQNCPACVAVADFNRDEMTDIVCEGFLLLSNGEGTFRAAGSACPAALCVTHADQLRVAFF